MKKDQKNQKNQKNSLRVSIETIRMLSFAQLTEAAGGSANTFGTTCGQHICFTERSRW
jgi:hypothetical protein